VIDRSSTVRAAFAGAVRVLFILFIGAALSGVSSGADGPVIDSDVRTAVAAGRVRVLVDLRVSSSDASAIESVQDETLRRLAGTDTRLARRFATAPLLALEIDSAALTRLEAMRDIVARVRADRIVPPNAERAPRR
jgi:hypothetical protein